ncbi:MAG TPA: hypothetical protein VGN63_05785 [Flavisolibacter sp.]|jgi:hypothetical protein|nr:hypothetical protein [Flavisolibacter sp.]
MISTSRTGGRNVEEPGSIRLYFFLNLQIFLQRSSSAAKENSTGMECSTLTGIVPERKSEPGMALTMLTDVFLVAVGSDTEPLFPAKERCVKMSRLKTSKQDFLQIPILILVKLPMLRKSKTNQKIFLTKNAAFVTDGFSSQHSGCRFVQLSG